VRTTLTATPKEAVKNMRRPSTATPSLISLKRKKKNRETQGKSSRRKVKPDLWVESKGEDRS